MTGQPRRRAPAPSLEHRASDSACAGAARPRDAARTRALLLRTARRRFALHGYAATTVRDIAKDAGVNIALISRYFDSKEGLFEACVESAVDELRLAAGGVTGLGEIAGVIARQTTVTMSGGRLDDEPLLILLRSSGDERAERLRVGVLRTYAEKLAGLAAREAVTAGKADLVLRAQLTLAIAIGMTLMRSWSTPLEPLASASEQELAAPLSAVVTALLGQVS